MQRDKGWRQQQRYTKAMRRIKVDRMEHKPYNSFVGQLGFDCACFFIGDRTGPAEDKRHHGVVFSKFADHPKSCRGQCCANPRKVFGHLTIQEQREKLDEHDEY